MEEEGLLHNCLQEKEDKHHNQSSIVDELLRKKLATRLKSRRKRTRSVDSDSSSAVCSLVDSPIDNFEDSNLSCSNSDFSTDERFQGTEESYHINDASVIIEFPTNENDSGIYKDHVEDDCNIVFEGASKSKKRGIFNSYSDNKLIRNAIVQDHVKSTLQHINVPQNEFRSSRKKLYAYHPHRSDIPRRKEKKGSFEYLNEILDSYLLPLFAAEKLDECFIDVTFSIKSLHQGLCAEWTNSESCSNENCPWSHEPKALFERKFSTFTELNITAILLYASPHDPFYLEILIEGFQVLVRKEVPDKWIPRLIFYLFTKTKSLQPSLSDFWFTVAKYFCKKKGIDNLRYGVVELLGIFCDVKSDDRWKVIKFLEMIKGPPFNLYLSYRLVKPILDFDIVPTLLTDIIKTCNKTQVDIIEAYLEVIPKIRIQDLPINGVEELIKYSDILSTHNAGYSEDLKARLQSKILTLPVDFDQEEYPLTYSYISKFVLQPKIDEEANYQTLIKDITAKLEENVDFDYFASSINEIKLDHVEKAEKDIMSVIFSMELDSHDAIGLIQAAVLNIKTKSSESITATLATSLIYDYIISQDWNTACSILTICCSKDLCLPYAKVIKRDLTLESDMSQAKLAFLLAEIYLNNQKYEEFITFFERYNLLDPSCRTWSVTEGEKSYRAKMQLIDKFFASAFSEEAIDLAYQLFFKIHKIQKRFQGPIDLRTYVSELIISFINQGNEELVVGLKNTFSNRLKLKPIAVRSLLAFLVQKNRLNEAKTLFTFNAKSIYQIPSVIKTSKDVPFTLRISSILSEEELYLLFDYFFAKMMKYKFLPEVWNKVTPEECKLNIAIGVESLVHDSNVKPWYLMEVNNTEEAVKKRIENLLEKKIVPPVKTFSEMSTLIFVDYISLHKLLLARFSNVKRL